MKPINIILLILLCHCCFAQQVKVSVEQPDGADSCVALEDYLTYVCIGKDEVTLKTPYDTDYAIKITGASDKPSCTFFSMVQLIRTEGDQDTLNAVLVANPLKKSGETDREPVTIPFHE